MRKTYNAATKGLSYPNFFGDVQMFAANMKQIILGKMAQEYAMPP
jgi:hypothetical protein